MSRWLVVRHPVALLLALLFLLSRDHSGVLRMGLAASILHEGGHLLVWWALGCGPPRLTLSLRGISLDVRGVRLPPKKEFLLAAAGPATNLLLCLLTFLALELRASYAGYLFAAANLLVGGFNLLPFGALDGRKMINLLLR